MTDLDLPKLKTIAEEQLRVIGYDLGLSPEESLFVIMVMAGAAQSGAMKTLGPDVEIEIVSRARMVVHSGELEQERS